MEIACVLEVFFQHVFVSIVDALTDSIMSTCLSFDLTGYFSGRAGSSSLDRGRSDGCGCIGASASKRARYLDRYWRAGGLCCSIHGRSVFFKIKKQTNKRTNERPVSQCSVNNQSTKNKQLETCGPQSLTHGSTSGGVSVNVKQEYPVDMVTAFHHGMQTRAHELSLTNKLFAIMGDAMWKRYGAEMYAKGMNVANILTEAYNNAFKDVDVLVMPTLPYLPSKIPDANIPLAEYVGVCGCVCVWVR